MCFGPCCPAVPGRMAHRAAARGAHGQRIPAVSTDPETERRGGAATCSRSVPFRPGHRPRRRTHQEKWRGLERSADRIASDARVVSELARRRACGCTRCHGSLLRHAARAIVTSRLLREARDRQLRQTVPAVVRDRPRITCTSAPPSRYPIGRIRKETGGTRPRPGPPRGRHRVAVYSNSASDSTSRTRSTCPAIDCLR